MRTIRCMIVDDEPLAQRVIENYARNLSYLEIGWKCDSALEALEALHGGAKPDVIFLDIEMPRLSGLGLVRSLKQPPLIVFTTAYENHAVEGFELDAIDYLKKPFSFERFMRSLERVQQQIELREPSKPPFVLPAALTGSGPMKGNGAGSDSHSPLFVKSGNGQHQIRREDIIMVEGMGDYVKLHLSNRSLVSHRSLKEWEETLPAEDFVRVHRSYLVAWRKIESVQGNEVRLADRALPIGRAYRASLMERLGVVVTDGEEPSD